jgi:hypothetical protein
MANNSFDKEKILEQLQTGVALVTFTKVDGSLRDMKCTLQPRLLPTPLKESTVKIDPESDALRVYDLEADGWRSFKISRIISIFETNE